MKQILLIISLLFSLNMAYAQAPMRNYGEYKYVYSLYKVTTKKWNAEECSNRFDLQRFHLSCRLFPTPP